MTLPSGGLGRERRGDANGDGGSKRGSRRRWEGWIVTGTLRVGCYNGVGGFGGSLWQRWTATGLLKAVAICEGECGLGLEFGS